MAYVVFVPLFVFVVSALSVFGFALLCLCECFFSRKHGEGFFRWVHLSCSHESARNHHHESHCKESLQAVIARSHCKESWQGVIARSHGKES